MNIVWCNFSQYYFAIEAEIVEKMPCCIRDFVKTSLSGEYCYFGIIFLAEEQKLVLHS